MFCVKQSNVCDLVGLYFTPSCSPHIAHSLRPIRSESSLSSGRIDQTGRTHGFLRYRYKNIMIICHIKNAFSSPHGLPLSLLSSMAFLYPFSPPWPSSIPSPHGLPLSLLSMAFLYPFSPPWPSPIPSLHGLPLSLLSSMAFLYPFSPWPYSIPSLHRLPLSLLSIAFLYPFSPWPSSILSLHGLSLLSMAYSWRSISPSPSAPT